MVNDRKWRRTKSADAPLPTVLSLQSHVVRSNVGGPAFTFPLQRQGFQVGCIFTTQFVDMYRHEGTTLTVSALRTLLDGVSPTTEALRCKKHDGNGWGRAGWTQTARVATTEPHCQKSSCQRCNGAQGQTSPTRTLSGWSTRPHDYIVSGFIGTASLVSEFAAWLGRLRQIYAECSESMPLYLCDPVLGDTGHIYVHPDCLPAYARLLLPLADIITPNHWEALWLVSQREKSFPVTGQRSASERRKHSFQAPSWQGEESSAPEAGAGWQPDHSGEDLKAPRTLSEAIDLVDCLHSLGPEVVVITSIELADERPPRAIEAADQSGNTTPSDTPALPGTHSSSPGCPSLYLVASRQKRSSPRCTPSCFECKGHPSAGSEPESTVSGTESSVVEGEGNPCEALPEGNATAGCGNQGRTTDYGTQKEEHISDDGSKRVHVKAVAQDGQKVSATSACPAPSTCRTSVCGGVVIEDREEEMRGLTKEEDDVVYFIRFPKQEATLCGSGDLWTALFLAAFHHCRYHLGDAIERALAGTQVRTHNIHLRYTHLQICH